MALAACLNRECVDLELQRAASPGGEFEALVSRRDSGALDTGDTIRVEIVDPGGGVGSGAKVATISSSRRCAQGKPNVEVHWDERALELTVDYHSDSDVWVKTRHKNIMIRYGHCDAYYATPSDADETPTDT